MNNNVKFVIDKLYPIYLKERGPYEIANTVNVIDSPPIIEKACIDEDEDLFYFNDTESSLKFRRACAREKDMNLSKEKEEEIINIYKSKIQKLFKELREEQAKVNLVEVPSLFTLKEICYLERDENNNEDIPYETNSYRFDDNLYFCFNFNKLKDLLPTLSIDEVHQIRQRCLDNVTYDVRKTKNVNEINKANWYYLYCVFTSESMSLYKDIPIEELYKKIFINFGVDMSKGPSEKERKEKFLNQIDKVIFREEESFEI